MNVFVLSTGRSGTTTFIEACKHITNYTVGHESRARKLGKNRITYPENHIEADNRLAWFLGRLNKHYGKEAFYVHLKRNKEAVARSLNQRWRPTGIIKAYTYGILMTDEKDLKYCRDYVETVNQNISFFLKDKPHTMEISLDTIQESFPEFWEKIGAKGNLQNALEALQIQHNATPSKLEHVKNDLTRLIKSMMP